MPVAAIIVLLGAAQIAAGPPAPAPAVSTAAEEAIRRYGEAHAAPAPCAPARAGEVVVCGGRSPDRLPLPDERAARDGPPTATGDAAHVGVEGGPFAKPPGAGVGLTLTVPSAALAGATPRWWATGSW